MLLHYFTNASALVLAGLLWMSSGNVHPSSLQSTAPRQGRVTLITTPDGANLPAGSRLIDFPVLLRLNGSTFPFAEASRHGEDFRVQTEAGIYLPVEIEAWDTSKKTATIWVRVPVIEGNTKQALILTWGGNQPVSFERKPVFTPETGYTAVLHMGASVLDSTQQITPQDLGTRPTSGVIGPARAFTTGKGIAGGEDLQGFPAGTGPHTSTAWVNVHRGNGKILAWGNEAPQGKVTMNFNNPPHIDMECYFSDADVRGKKKVSLNEWIYIAYTVTATDAKLYVNGQIDTVNPQRASTLKIDKTSKFWIGGWYGNFDFEGTIDELRIANRERSPDWIKCEYENQKPLQTLVGPVITKAGASVLDASPKRINESATLRVVASLNGAQKVTWKRLSGAVEEILAVDEASIDFVAPRVSKDTNQLLRFEAVTATGIQRIDIPITVKNVIADPKVTLEGPSQWDGRTQVRLQAKSDNESTANPPTTFRWATTGIGAAVVAEDGDLVLQRGHKSGLLTVTLTYSNGGQERTLVRHINVTIPAQDTWVPQTSPLSRLTDHLFVARGEKRIGSLLLTGNAPVSSGTVTLNVTSGGLPYKTVRKQVGPQGRYDISCELEAGLRTYTATLSHVLGNKQTPLSKGSDIICGDAYIVMGQSNAVATDFGKDTPSFSSGWIRTFNGQWENASYRNQDGANSEIGYWAMELAKKLVETHKIPICIMNGAVGGTRIDQHQRDVKLPDNPETLYGKLLGRVSKAGLTAGIRGIFWHQGENDQGADGPMGGYGYEMYQRLFVDLVSSWATDYPNVQHIYGFQIWPKSCAMGINGSDNKLRDVQRTLPDVVGRMSVMSTLGIDPPGGCHFPAEGYAAFARLIFPLVERENYGVKTTQNSGPAHLKRIDSAGPMSNRLILTFDQPVVWSDNLKSEFYLGGKRGLVQSGVARGNRLELTFSEAVAGRPLTYLDSAQWSQTRLLRGVNGIAALTFYDVPTPTR